MNIQVDIINCSELCVHVHIFQDMASEQKKKKKKKKKEKRKKWKKRSKWLHYEHLKDFI